MSDIKQLWQQFEIYFLEPLKHHYNEDDEQEFVNPLRDAIMGANMIHVYQFTIAKHTNDGGYNVCCPPDYIGMALDKNGVVNLVKQFMREHEHDWGGPTAAQFEEKFWQVADALGD